MQKGTAKLLAQMHPEQGRAPPAAGFSTSIARPGSAKGPSFATFVVLSRLTDLIKSQIDGRTAIWTTTSSSTFG
jgi:hypothetical protein